MVIERIGRLLPLSLFVLLASCATLPLQVERPQGFAEERDRFSYRAISPEGLLYRVRTVDNDPPKDLEFWSEALRHHLSAEGYPMIGGEQRFTAAREGVFYEWGVRHGSSDCIYLTAILVFDDVIVVAEAGGEHTFYRQYRDELIRSLESIRMGR